jgi:hypothetical protein
VEIRREEGRKIGDLRSEIRRYWGEEGIGERESLVTGRQEEWKSRRQEGRKSGRENERKRGRKGEKRSGYGCG